MIETLGLSPFAKNYGLAESTPGLNVPSKYEFELLFEAAETLGIDIIEKPFPGESEGLCPAIRRDIWRMWLRSNLGVRDSLVRRIKEVGSPIVISPIAAAIGILAILSYVEYSIIMFFGTDSITMIPLMSLNIFITMTFYSVLDCLEFNRSHHIKQLIDDDSHIWPYRTVLCLKFAMDKMASLSLELQALIEFIDEVGPESNWGVVFLEDQIAMSKLSHSLDSNRNQFSKGFIIGLSRENSELVSRACSAVKPGRLEVLMGRLELPGTLKI